MDGIVKSRINAIITQCLFDYKELENKEIRPWAAVDLAVNKIEEMIDKYYLENWFRSYIRK